MAKDEYKSALDKELYCIYNLETGSLSPKSGFFEDELDSLTTAGALNGGNYPPTYRCKRVTEIEEWAAFKKECENYFIQWVKDGDPINEEEGFYIRNYLFHQKKNDDTGVAPIASQTMNATGKTIQIFLPDGNPRSVKIAEITSRTVQVLLVPRAKLEFALSREELNNVGIYFLVADDDDLGLPTVYVGEAENVGDRLRTHNKKKDFWTHALVAISKTQFFTKAHVKYLESVACDLVRTVGRANLENGNDPTKSHVSEAAAADLADNFDTIKILVGTLGYSFLEKPVQPEQTDILYCKTKKAKATGEYSEDGFTVFAGSTCNLKTTPACQAWIIKIRERLIESGILTEEDDLLRFTKDYTFASPSAAGGVIKGRSTNGWTSWTYKNGKTLDEVKRM